MRKLSSIQFHCDFHQTFTGAGGGDLAKAIQEKSTSQCDRAVQFTVKYHQLVNLLN